MRPKRFIAIGAIAALASVTTANTASAGYMFTQVSSNGNTPVAQQFSLDVFDRGGGVIGLQVSNTGPISSTVSEFHVDDGNGRFSSLVANGVDGGGAYIGSGSGVDFGPPPPGNGNLADAPVGFSTDFFATADPPPSARGVDPGEWFELRLVLAAGATLGEVLTDLSTGSMRAGIHVISIDDAGSETFVTDGRIPAPGPITLGAAALGLMGVRRRRH